MKAMFGLWVFVWAVVGGMYAQDVPPPFENVAEENAGTAEEMIDPFDPAVDAPKIINVQVEFIEMAHKDITRLLMENKQETTDATALRMKVQEMVDGDKAKLLDTLMVPGRSGQKTTSESRPELIYPTEYTPPVRNEKAEEKGTLSFPAGPATPTAFETRNLGSTLESEPTLGEDSILVDLRLLTSMTWHTGDTVWSESKDNQGNFTKVTMPEIYEMEINTSLSCISGQYNMIGVVSPKDENGRMDTERKVMVFVKCDLLPVIP